MQQKLGEQRLLGPDHMGRLPDDDPVRVGGMDLVTYLGFAPGEQYHYSIGTTRSCRTICACTILPVKSSEYYILQPIALPSRGMLSESFLFDCDVDSWRLFVLSSVDLHHPDFGVLMRQEYTDHLRSSELQHHTFNRTTFHDTTLPPQRATEVSSRSIDAKLNSLLRSSAS